MEMIQGSPVIVDDRPNSWVRRRGECDGESDTYSVIFTHYDTYDTHDIHDTHDTYDTYDIYTNYTNYFQVRQDLGLADHVWQDRRTAFAQTVDALGDQFRAPVFQQAPPKPARQSCWCGSPAESILLLVAAKTNPLCERMPLAFFFN